MGIISIASVLLFNIFVNLFITKQRQVMLSLTLFATLVSYTLIFNQYQEVLIFGLQWKIDGFASYLIVLTTLIIPFCILIDSRAILYYLVIEFLLCALFATNNLLVFYVLYEAILLPMFMLIANYGKSTNKYQASLQFIVYTVAASLVMLVGIIYIYVTYKTLDITYLATIKFLPYQEMLLVTAFMVGFLVKIPVVPIHLWLPEAHTEAPTSGSVILAAIILKLGAYGVMKIVIPLFSNSMSYINGIIIVIYTVTILYTGLTTIRQIDLKKVVAYSSIAHMNFAMLGTCSNSTYGLIACFIIMISHGFVSSAMFTIVGSIYSYTTTRKIALISGLSQVMPITSIFALIIFFANMSLPPLSGFIGEYVILVALVEKNLLLAVLTCSIMFLTTIYSLVLYTKIFHGNIKPYSTVRFKDVSRLDFNILLGYLIWIIIIGVNPNLITSIVEYTANLNMING